MRCMSPILGVVGEPRRERALFVLGYFPFYEYAVISRSLLLRPGS